MSQRPNHRRGEPRHQDNGPRYESSNPMAGCNSTHVARGRRRWHDLRRRADRHKAKHEHEHDPELNELDERAFEQALDLRYWEHVEVYGAPGELTHTILDARFT